MIVCPKRWTNCTLYSPKILQKQNQIAQCVPLEHNLNPLWHSFERQPSGNLKELFLMINGREFLFFLNANKRH